MIPYILIALISLFVAYIFGAAAGYGAGYKVAYSEMLPIVKQLEKLTNDVLGAIKNGNTTDASSERGDTKTP